MTWNRFERYFSIVAGVTGAGIMLGTILRMIFIEPVSGFGLVNICIGLFDVGMAHWVFKGTRDESV